jgi:hypothetical protein
MGDAPNQHTRPRRTAWWLDVCATALLTVLAMNFAYGLGYKRGRNDAINAVVRTAPALISNVMWHLERQAKRNPTPHDGGQ